VPVLACLRALELVSVRACQLAALAPVPVPTGPWALAPVSVLVCQPGPVLWLASPAATPNPAGSILVSPVVSSSK